MKLRHRGCPLCDNKYNSTGVRYTREFPDHGPKVATCVRCSAVFLNPVMTDEEYGRFYNNDGQKKFVQKMISNNYQYKPSEADRRRADLISKNIRAGARVLDVGTGYSNFVGLIDNATGIDISEPRVESAKQKGLDVRLCDINDWNEPVDVVTLFHVLEHIPEPKEFVSKIYNILNEDGILVVEVPNHDDALVRLKGYCDFYYQNAHCTYFTPSTLRLLLEKFKFDMIYGERVQRYSLDNHLHWLIKGKPGAFKHIGILNPIYSWVIKTIGMHDTVFLVCKKRSNR